MAWYGYVSPGKQGVYDNYQDIENLYTLNPFSSFRRCYSEEAAWEFVRRHTNKNKLLNIKKYGNIFYNNYVTVDYIIGKESVFYNIKTNNIGYIKLFNNNDDVYIQNFADLITVELKNTYLSRNGISSHLIAIYHILEILGTYVDVELIVPNHSVFYALTTYSGNKRVLVKIIQYIKNRKGKVALTINGWSTKEEDE